MRSANDPLMTQLIPQKDNIQNVLRVNKGKVRLGK